MEFNVMEGGRCASLSLYSDVESGEEIGGSGHDVTELHGGQVAVAIDVRLVEDLVGDGFNLVGRQSAFVSAQARDDRLQILQADHSVGVHI